MFKLEDIFQECYIDQLYKPKSLLEALKFSLKKEKLCKYRYFDISDNKAYCRFYMQKQPFFPKEYLKDNASIPWKPEITD
jgi:hypothetical protein